MSEINAQTQSVAERLADAFKNASSGTTDKVDGSAWRDHLVAKEIDVENFEKGLAELAPFTAGSALAFGRTTEDAFAADKSLTRVSGEVGLSGKNKIALTAKREVTYPAGPNGGEAPVYHNEIAASIVLDAARSSVGQFSVVKAALRESASKRLKD